MLRKSKSEKNPLLEQLEPSLEPLLEPQLEPPLEPLSIEALEFCVFSFNLGGYNDSSFTDYNTIQKDFKKIFVPSDKRIWMISTQEDKQGSTFMKNLIKYFTTINYVVLQSFGTDTGKRFLSSGSSYKNKIVKIIVFIPESLQSYFTSLQPILVKHSTLLNKSTLIIQILFQSQSQTSISYNTQSYNSGYGYNNNRNKTKQLPVLLTFVGSHLPINTKEDFKLGYDKRATAMNECLNQLANLYGEFKQKYNNGSFHILWTGDLNFRLEKIGDTNSDQLLKYLNQQNNYTLFEHELLDFTPINTMAPTCKTIADTAKKINNNGNNGINNNEKKPLLQNVTSKKGCTETYRKSLSEHTKEDHKCYEIIVKRKKLTKRLQTKNSNANKVSCMRNIEKNSFNKNSKCFGDKSVLKSSGKEASLLRFPSYCDRILGFSSEGSLKLTPALSSDINIDLPDLPDLHDLPDLPDQDKSKFAVRPIVSLDFVSISDHNPIFGTFKIYNQYETNV